MAAFVVFGGANAFAQASAPPATWSVTYCQGCREKNNQSNYSFQPWDQGLD